jgi:hypothetical protein
MAVGASAGSMIRNLDSEGIPSPSGLPRWNKKAIAHFLSSDLYRPYDAAEVAKIVAPEVVAKLDAERTYALWRWNRRKTMKRTEWDDTKGDYVPRYKIRERPREEWLAVPVDVTDAGLSADTVDRAREAAKDRYRKPSRAGGRFWQLRGIAYCGACGSVLSPHTVSRTRADGSRAQNYYYQCRRHYNTGPRDCEHARSYPAGVLEETAWDTVYRLISNSHRLLRQYEEHIERERQELRLDPAKKVSELAEQLQSVEQERRGYLRQNARDVLTDEELDDLLAEVDARRKGLQKALSEAQARQDTRKKSRINYAHLDRLLLQMNRIDLGMAAPADRRRLYAALRLRADVDQDDTIRLSGIFEPDVYLPGMLQDWPDWLSPCPKVPEGTKVVVASGGTHWKT